jgi:hypothetical protein
MAEGRVGATNGNIAHEGYDGMEPLVACVYIYCTQSVLQTSHVTTRKAWRGLSLGFKWLENG